MNTAPLDLSIIIINWNTRQLLLQTVESVYANPPGDYSYEIIVVDNNSSDGSPEALTTACPGVRLIANRDNRGFGPANNQALKVASGRHSLLLNSDTIVQPGSLQKIIAFMDDHPQVGLCGVRVLNNDGTFQGSFADFLKLRSEFLILTGLGRRLKNKEYPSFNEAKSLESGSVATIQGAFMFARTEALRQIGWLDEQFFMYGEENDLSLRLKRAGWLTWYLADVTVIHLGGQSTRKNWSKMVWQLQKSKVLLFKKHYGGAMPLGFKLLVSAAVLTKAAATGAKQALKPKNGQVAAHWFNWADFRQFWQV